MGITNESYTGIPIFLRIPQACCDLCFCLFKSQRIMAGVRVVIEMRDPPMFTQQGIQFIIPGYGLNLLAVELNESGWTSEIFHGKQFILCPSCGEKPTVERSQSDFENSGPMRPKKEENQMPDKIEVPNPLPTPIPGGGPQDGYQFKFNQRYYQTRDARLRSLAYGIAAGLDPNVSALLGDDQTNLADTLYDWKAPGGLGVYGPNHVDFDEQCDYWRYDPYQTMYSRSQIYGYQRVPVGTGNTTQPPNVVNPADLQGPPVPGQYLLVTCDINLL